MSCIVTEILPNCRLPLMDFRSSIAKGLFLFLHWCKWLPHIFSIGLHFREMDVAVKPFKRHGLDFLEWGLKSVSSFFSLCAAASHSLSLQSDPEVEEGDTAGERQIPYCRVTYPTTLVYDGTIPDSNRRLPSFPCSQKRRAHSEGHMS